MTILPNAVIVLRALLKGIPVEIDERTYVKNVNDQICIKTESINAATRERKEVFLGTDFMTLDYFIKVTNEMTDDQIAQIANNIGLNL